MERRIAIDVSCSKTVNFAMQQNRVPVIQSLKIQNKTATALNNVVLTIESKPAFAPVFQLNIGTLQANQSVDMDRDALRLTLDPDFLMAMTERIAGTLTFSVSSASPTSSDSPVSSASPASPTSSGSPASSASSLPISPVSSDSSGSSNSSVSSNSAKTGAEIRVEDSVTREIDVLAYNEWGGRAVVPELIASFVTPNHPLIAKILRRASEKLREWTGDSALCAYARQSENDVLRQMAAIFAALEEQDIAYCVPPAGFETDGQKIRLCDDIFQQKLGTCLDLTVLYASCLEQAGLNPLIIFTTGHAFVGCWLIPETFPCPCQDDFSLLSKRFDPSVGEISVVESTMFVQGRNVDFDQAARAAEKHFLDSGTFQYFIDVKQARLSGIRPIPQRKYDAEGRLLKFSEAAAAEEEARVAAQAAEWGAPREIDIVRGADGGEGPVKLSKQRIWQNKLLNLSTRNSLLSFRPAGSSIQLVFDKLETLEDALAAGDEFRILEFFPKVGTTENESHFASVAKDEDIGELLKSEFENRRLRTFLNETETSKKIIALYRSAKTSLEENGSNTLYLAMGFLKWYETDISEKARYAPLILLPLEIIRKSARLGYVIRARDEETHFNITLLEKLKAEFDIRIQGLDPLPMDDSGVDIKKIFATVRHAVMNKKRWDVEEFAFIGQFSFSQYIMWNDIKSRSEELMSNRIVESLVRGSFQGGNVQLESPEGLDERCRPSDMAVPLSADSSQLAAICSAAKGCSFVLHGPPGTGKSQTITNMIANALFNGKSVLFIAEKMAALSVVQNRLEKIGLGPFCLELHSNKTSKSSVANQLGAALNFARKKPPEEYAAEAERLRQSREALNSLMEKIHQPRPSGLSLYECICDFEARPELGRAITFPGEILSAATAEARQKWEDDCGKLSITAAGCGNFRSHPLAEWRCTQFSEAKRTDVESLLESVSAEAGRLSGILPGVQKRFPALRISGARRDLAAFDGFIGSLGAAEYLAPELLMRDAAPLQKPLTDACSLGRRLKTLKGEILKDFEAEIFELDAGAVWRSWKEALDKWFIPRFFAKKKILKQLKYYAREPKSFNEGCVAVLLKNLIEAGNLTKSIGTLGASSLAGAFGSSWQGADSDWDLLEKQHQAAMVLRRHLTAICADPAGFRSLCEEVAPLAEFRAQNSELFDAFRTSLRSLTGLWDKFADAVVFREQQDDPGNQGAGSSWLDLLRRKLPVWKAALPQWRDWCSYLAQRQVLLDDGLACAVKALEEGAVGHGDFTAAFRASLAFGLAAKYIDANQSLGGMNSELLEYEIQKYRDAATRFEDLTRRELIARLSANIPSSTFASDTTEVGILKKNIANKCRNNSIRKLFDSIPNLLRRLAPCMLMSPISVAQYIDPKFPRFDLIIFDEASQLPTCEAVGAIARGENLVVVGDPNQLPPTSFFKKGYTDEDNLEKEDLESILDDCLAISMPEMHLLWHYRSRDESLIAFSNYKYYGHQLFTFPSPNDLAGSVRFVPVEGFYDKGKTRQNKAEAEAIVRDIIRRLEDPAERRKSIGIVTFSSVQQNLIDDMLEKEFARSPQLEEFSRESGEPLFVKNLESVQGDERDVIMFSIGYGPDKSGSVSLNFGPLNNAGGWRRLNVAVSRARQEMVVFSALQPEQIDLSRTSSDGVAGLKAFLTFAKNGKNSLPAAVPVSESDASGLDRGKSLDRFRASVAEELRKLGWRVEENVGTSKYKIDLAVLHPEKQDEYILGILCDGETYRESATCRDRNILQKSILEGLGWNIARIWSVEWFIRRDNREKIIQGLQRRVKEALEAEKRREEEAARRRESGSSGDGEGDGPAEGLTGGASSRDSRVSQVSAASLAGAAGQRAAGSGSASSAASSGQIQQQGRGSLLEEDEDGGNLEESDGGAASAFRQYALASIAIPDSTMDFYDTRHNMLIRSQIEKIISVESPISEHMLFSRIAEIWSAKKTGRFTERVQGILRGMTLFKGIERGDSVFFWKDGVQVTAEFRTPAANMRRQPEDISIREIASVVQAIVQEQMSIEAEDVEKIISGLAGYLKCTAQMKEVIDDAIDYAVKAGLAVRNGSRIAVAPNGSRAGGMN